MRTRAAPRWAISFADLCLLLLGFFVLLQAHPDAGRLASGIRSALGRPAAAPLEIRARTWFEPGEAVLRPQARAALGVFVKGATRVAIVTRGTEPRTPRFDGWELAAARAAAIARAIAAEGVREDRVALTVEPATGGGQVVLLSRE